jgi:hypothetical protein
MYMNTNMKNECLKNLFKFSLFFTAQWALTVDGILTGQLPKGLRNSLDKNKPFSQEVFIKVYVTKKI